MILPLFHNFSINTRFNKYLSSWRLHYFHQPHHWPLKHGQQSTKLPLGWKINSDMNADGLADSWRRETHPWENTYISPSSTHLTQELFFLVTHSLNISQRAHSISSRSVGIIVILIIIHSFIISNRFSFATITTIHAHIHTYRRFAVTFNLHVFGLWEEAGEPGENPRGHGENTETPHRKVPPQPGIKPTAFSLLGNSANH